MLTFARARYQNEDVGIDLLRSFFIYYFFFLCWVSVAVCRLSLVVEQRRSYSEACGILVPGPGIEPEFPAFQGIFNHWATREVPSH